MEARLLRLLTQAVSARVFPGAVAGIALGPPAQRWEAIVTAGHLTYPPPASPAVTPETVFDLASLTKPLATTLAVLALIKSGLITLESTLPELLRRPIPQAMARITLRHLLAHSSGLPAHRPYFQTLRDIAPNERRERLLAWILEERLIAPPGQVACYSDLGFLLLGWMVEIQSGLPLDRFVAETIYHPWGLEENLFFRPLPPGPDEGRIFAPSEQCPWRQTLLSGVVHDDNCYVLGGVAGQAGLFGDMRGVLSLGVRLLDLRQGRGEHPALRADDLRRALRREGSVPGSGWGLGFDTPAAAGSSAGRYLAPESFGHLGFTGVSLWIDPGKELVLVLLCHRVHPSRDNPRIKPFRPLFHDTILEALGLANSPGG